jgi:uncharacterized membrane protein (UPF0127 family)
MGLSTCSAQARFERKNMVLQGSAGTVAIQVEIARTDEQRSQGLMHRTRLDDGRGMLFVFDRDEMVSFWMKNTLIPLSIAFISSDGRIMEIRDMEPESLDPVRSGRSVRYALEVPQGWFSRVNLGVGDRLLLE